MRRLLAVTVGFGMALVPLSGAWAKVAPTPTLKAPSGNLYRAGETCPAKDVNKKSHSSGSAIIKCELIKGGDKIRYRWLNA